LPFFSFNLQQIAYDQNINKFFIDMLSSTFLAAYTAALAMTASAIPAPSTQLAKRGEGIHLMDCHSRNPNSNWVASIVIYCADDGKFCGADKGIGDSIYNNNDVCIVNEAALNTWEGKTESCTFPTGVKFTWNLEANAASAPYYALVE
jgi:hypothetical protein